MMDVARGESVIAILPISYLLKVSISGKTNISFEACFLGLCAYKGLAHMVNKMCIGILCASPCLTFPPFITLALRPLARSEEDMLIQIDYLSYTMGACADILFQDSLPIP